MKEKEKTYHKYSNEERGRKILLGALLLFIASCGGQSENSTASRIGQVSNGSKSTAYSAGLSYNANDTHTTAGDGGAPSLNQTLGGIAIGNENSQQARFKHEMAMLQMQGQLDSNARKDRGKDLQLSELTNALSVMVMGQVMLTAFNQSNGGKPDCRPSSTLNSLAKQTSEIFGKAGDSTQAPIK